MDNLKEIFKNELSSHKNLLWFETSGSSGDHKVIGLSKDGFLEAAKSVNTSIGIESTDKWLIAIPTYHVGGASIIARSTVGGFSTYLLENKWNPEECLKVIEEKKITFISLVPTQVFDLVKTKKKAPPSLKRIILGGGEASSDIISRASELGFNIIETYGMTETSALAAIKHGETFTLLSHLSIKESLDRELQFKGEAVVQKIGRVIDGRFEINDPRIDGWFTSSDLGEVNDEKHFKFLGRKNRVVKILGELVSLESIERKIQVLFPEEKIAVVDYPNERRGRELALFVESGREAKTVDEVNEQLDSLERIEKIRILEKFPVLLSGKVDFVKLAFALH